MHGNMNVKFVPRTLRLLWAQTYAYETVVT